MSIVFLPVIVLFIVFFAAIVFGAGRAVGPAANRAGSRLWILGLAICVPLAFVLLGLLFSVRSVSSVRSASSASSPQPLTSEVYVAAEQTSEVYVAAEQTLIGQTASSAPVESYVAMAEAPSAHVASPQPPASYEWAQAMSREPSLPRDPHTSMTTLKAYMAASIDSSLMRAGEGARKVWLVVEEKVPQELVTAVREETGAETPKSPSTDITAADAVVRLRWAEPPSSEKVPWLAQRMQRGTLVADIKAPRGEEVVKARLEEKAWLDQPPVQSGSHTTIVVTTGEPAAPTREEAVRRLNQAMSAAVGNLVESQVAALSSQWHASPDDVRSQVMARYSDPRNAYDDQVVQKVDGPHGRVWYAAGLVRVPSDAVAQMAQSAQHVSQDRRGGWAKAIGGAVGMLLVLLVLYAIMNAVTRGYFRGHLRAAVAIMLAVAVVMMFLRMA